MYPLSVEMPDLEEGLMLGMLYQALYVVSTSITCLDLYLLTIPHCPKSLAY